MKIKEVWQVLKSAGAGFRRHKVLKLSASLAYYTIFSIGPMLLVMIFFSNLFWGREAIEGKIYSQISGMVGDGAAVQIQEIIENASITGNNFTAIISFVILIVAATSAFIEMQDSINMIWNLKLKKNTGWKLMLQNRLLSFSIVAGLGFLLLVSLVINTLLEVFMDKLQEMFPRLAVVAFYIVNLVVTLLVVTFLFAIIFKVLPDAMIKWKDVLVGALFTAILFMVGKFCITLYLSKSNMGSAYGTAGSLVVLMLWVYFSSAILYFGAEFTKAYAVQYGSEIRPGEYAVTVQVVNVESNADSVQENERNAEETEKEVQKDKDNNKKVT
ncbi:MAG: YihY/virulence factor BrkB family protein [Chitinophagaceae bacterium]